MNFNFFIHRIKVYPRNASVDLYVLIASKSHLWRNRFVRFARDVLVFFIHASWKQYACYEKDTVKRWRTITRKKTQGCFTKKLMSKDTSNIFHFFNQQLLNEAEYDENNYADRGGCYTPRMKAEVHTILRDLQNSSHHKKAETSNCRLKVTKYKIFLST